MKGGRLRSRLPFFINAENISNNQTLKIEIDSE